MGVDGFRLDVVNFFLHDRALRDNPVRPLGMPRPAGANPNDAFFDLHNLYNFNQPGIIEILKLIRQLMAEYLGTTTLAEISSAEDTLLTSSKYVRCKDRLHMAYNSELVKDEPFSYTRLREMIKRIEAQFQNGVICWTAGTHDFPRLKSRWQKHLQGDRFLTEAFDRLLAALILALKGSCCIYQGLGKYPKYKKKKYSGSFTVDSSNGVILQKGGKQVKLSTLGTFRIFLENKAKTHGGLVESVDTWYPSSKLCCQCQRKKTNLKLSDRIYDCDSPFCKAIDRDLNSAINLENAPLDKIVNRIGSIRINACELSSADTSDNRSIPKKQ